jgi:tetratricopeptide (TPR) repeat protein
MNAEIMEALAILRPSTRHKACAQLLCAIGFDGVVFAGDPTAAELLVESVARAKHSGDHSEIGLCLCAVAIPAIIKDRADEARRNLDEAVLHFRECGDLEGMAIALNTLALLDMGAGDLHSARRGLEEAVEILTMVGNRWMRAMQLAPLGLTWLLEGNAQVALPIYLDALESAHQMGAQDPYPVIGLAMCESRLGDRRRAAVLHGSAIGLVERRGEHLDPMHSRAADEDRAQLRHELGTDQFDWAVEEGKRLTFEQVVLETRRRLQEH